MPTWVILVATIIVAVLVFGLGFAVLLSRFYRKVDQGKALIINKMKAEPVVTFTGGVVVPIFHRAEVMDISVKTIELERRAHEGLICKDNVRADIKVTFFVRVNKTADDVMKVAQTIGCARASDQKTLEELFIAKFSEALKTVGKRLEFEQLYTQRDDFKDQIIEVIGKDLNGYVLDDAAIDYLEQTPLEHLDAKNILDAQGIRKITELTSTQNVRTNEIKQKERMEMGSQDLKADEAIYRFDQARADALAKKDKEIAMAQTREANEALRVKAEEEKKTALTRQKAEEEVSIGEQNKLRAIEVSMKAREREVAVETVRVKKAADVEEIGREREVELKRIDKEKELEQKRKDIADVIRQRIAVEKTVAEEEERIKDTRAHADAERQKKVKIVAAEAEAQEELVKNIKAAEAQEEVAKYNAREKLTIAEADLEAADKTARAKMRLAEGVQAEQAASGLAKVRVQEAEAVAIEKQGKAQAQVTLERMTAEAAGTEKKGLAAVKVRQAEAEATRQEGTAEADVIKTKKLAEAAGEEEKGLAAARVREAEAAAIEKTGLAEAAALEKRGLAEAVAVKEKLAAEASGLAQKADAMKALDGVGREHEEYRLQLEMKKEVALKTVHAQVEIAERQATVLAAAFESADIDIVGGDGQFFDQFIKAVSLGRSVDGFVGHSDVAQKGLAPYLEGQASLPADVKEILAGKVTSENLKNLGVAGLLAQLAGDADGDTRRKLQQLAEQARKLGLDVAGR